MTVAFAGAGSGSLAPPRGRFPGVPAGHRAGAFAFAVGADMGFAFVHLLAGAALRLLAFGPPKIALVNTPGYNATIADFCSLQYNYSTNVKPTEIFNPYTSLVHGTLNSNAYAFSIDDKAAFKSVPSAPGTSSNQLIITIGGAKGLINNNQAPLPTAKTFATYCH